MWHRLGSHRSAQAAQAAGSRVLRKLRRGDSSVGSCGIYKIFVEGRELRDDEARERGQQCPLVRDEYKALPKTKQ